MLPSSSPLLIILNIIKTSRSIKFKLLLDLYNTPTQEPLDFSQMDSKPEDNDSSASSDDKDNEG